jgi:precorrin-4/cobalt-precorrin-4 C11-methyltransferase
VISFVGAGPGAPDLLTLRGARRLADADVVVWAASLVPEAVLSHCRADVEVHDSAGLTLEDVTAIYAAHPDAAIVRLHSGDPSAYSAVGEQIDWCVAHERAFEIVPGVSSMAAAAAAAGQELTIPGLAQSVVMTRLAHRTAASVPEGREGVARFARLGATMALFLSAARPEALRDELLAEGSAYDASTPALLAHRVSWPDERLVRTTVGALPDAIAELGATTTVMVLVGDALRDDRVPARSHVYAPSYTHSFREATS